MSRTVTGAIAPTLSSSATGLGDRALLVVALLAAASAAWWIASRRAARFRPVRSHTGHERRSHTGHERAAASSESAALTDIDLGAALGIRATFVQFSAQTCASCPQVRRVLSSLADTEPGVVHVDLASEEHMDLVRRFAVFRTPTVLLLDSRGAVHSRTSGPLTADRALAALAELTHPATRSIHA
jgi:thiol-disulfide isomerase/thioredoxin